MRSGLVRRSVAGWHVPPPELQADIFAPNVEPEVIRNAYQVETSVRDAEAGGWVGGSAEGKPSSGADLGVRVPGLLAPFVAKHINQQRWPARRACPQASVCPTTLPCAPLPAVQRRLLAQTSGGQAQRKVSAFELIKSGLDISALFEARDDVVTRHTRFSSRAPLPTITAALENAAVAVGGRVTRDHECRWVPRPGPGVPCPLQSGRLPALLAGWAVRSVRRVRSVQHTLQEWICALRHAGPKDTLPCAPSPPPVPPGCACSSPTRGAPSRCWLRWHRWFRAPTWSTCRK
jgi:hypothetical protein